MASPHEILESWLEGMPPAHVLALLVDIGATIPDAFERIRERCKGGGRKIFVKNISFDSSSETIRKYFEQFGFVEEAVIVYDRAKKKSRGYGFVTFMNAASVSLALKHPIHVIDGRDTEASLAVPDKQASTMMFQPSSSFPYQSPGFNSGMSASPFVNNSPGRGYGPLAEAAGPAQRPPANSFNPHRNSSPYLNAPAQNQSPNVGIMYPANSSMNSSLYTVPNQMSLSSVFPFSASGKVPNYSSPNIHKQNDHVLTHQDQIMLMQLQGLGLTEQKAVLQTMSPQTMQRVHDGLRAMHEPPNEDNVDFYAQQNRINNNQAIPNPAHYQNSAYDPSLSGNPSNLRAGNIAPYGMGNSSSPSTVLNGQSGAVNNTYPYYGLLSKQNQSAFWNSSSDASNAQVVASSSNWMHELPEMNRPEYVADEPVGK